MLIDDIMALSPVMPIMVLEDAASAPDLAHALMAGGVRVAEVTLRTPAALQAIRAMKRAAPDMAVGAGTLLSPDDVKRAQDAGADFLVTPGVAPKLLVALLDSGLPLLPGAATGSEVAALLEGGITRAKFFPAEQAGGPAWLSAIYGPFPAMRFCPTGGITRALAPAYLRLPNVGCVGGSWLASAKAIAAHDWAGIEANARATVALQANAPHATDDQLSAI
jgi:2-dehydro-3-deoxyphosphogluconate aldolase/(4S)-4-hydroxy-2-oxoglutarate aldolase